MSLRKKKWTFTLSVMSAALFLHVGHANAQEGGMSDKLFSELSACGLRITAETRDGLISMVDSVRDNLEGEVRNVPREKQIEFIMAAMAATIDLDTGNGGFCYRYSNSRDVETLFDIIAEHIAAGVSGVNMIFGDG